MYGYLEQLNAKFCPIRIKPDRAMQKMYEKKTNTKCSFQANFYVKIELSSKPFNVLM